MSDNDYTGTMQFDKKAPKHKETKLAETYGKPRSNSLTLSDLVDDPYLPWWDTFKNVASSSLPTVSSLIFF